MPEWVSSPVHRALIAALVEVRKAAGLTQRDLAAKLGKPPSYVGKVESIERNLGTLEFMEWCVAVDVAPTVVMARVTDHENVPMNDRS